MKSYQIYLIVYLFNHVKLFSTYSFVGALEDFIAKEKKPEAENKTENNSVVPNSQEWTNDFIQEAASQFEDKFANFLAGVDPNTPVTPEVLQQRLQQMADAAQNVLDNPSQVSDASTDIASSISQAIQGLTAGAESLQEPLLEDEIMKMFGGGGVPAQENNFLPFMQGKYMIDCMV